MVRTSEAGVTRLELLLATAAAAALLVLGSWFLGPNANAREAAQETARRIANAAADWKRDHGDLGCPTVSQLIVDRAWDATDDAGDPWGGRFRIHCSAGELSVHSAGEDGRFETDDDILVGAPWHS